MPTTIKIFIGADHAGFALKEHVKKFLDQKKVAYQDLGNTILDKNDDYPDFSFSVAVAVAKQKNSIGLLFCGSAQGACITANKVKGIRAAEARNVKEGWLARAHDDVNVLCLPGGQQLQKTARGLGVSPVAAQKIITAWLSASFPAAARHARRVAKIKKIEQKNFK